MKLNNKRTILVGLAFLSICAFWQMYDNVVPLILRKTFHMNETFAGVIMAAARLDIPCIVVQAALLHLLCRRLPVVDKCADFLRAERGGLHVYGMQDGLVVELHPEIGILRIGLYGHDGGRRHDTGVEFVSFK